jgi:UDP-N-acetylmuramate--alanine ligase
MSALATHALKNFTVSGSDLRSNALTEALRRRGAYIYEGCDAELAATASFVVYNAAIKDDDLELAAARAAGVPLLRRGEYLAKVASEFDKCAAVSGIHGKSTTTALVAAILKKAEMKFAAHIGAEVKDVGGNYFFGGNEIFVTEACEYKGSFLSLTPDVAAILNVEMDHPDYYENEEKIFENFRRFAERIKSGGTLVVNADEKYRKIYEALPLRVLTFGIESGDFSACNMRRTNEKNRGFTFDFFIGGEFVSEVKNKLYGVHNVLNALAAAAVAVEIGAKREDVIEVLENFEGVKRRFENLGTLRGFGITNDGSTADKSNLFISDEREKLGIQSDEKASAADKNEKNNCYIISDYAHHPSEIRAVIKSAKQAFDGKIAVCFQPHTYSRTAKLFSDFSTCFEGADALILFKEYPARETPDCGKSAFELFSALSNENGSEPTRETSDCGKSELFSTLSNENHTEPNNAFSKPIFYADGISSLKALLKEKIVDFSCVLLLGAGDMAETFTLNLDSVVKRH